MDRHFVLVHGACHGAWCWYKVMAVLKSLGHKATAVDLAASGTNPKLAAEVRCVSDYAEPLMEFLAASPAEERVILVGHSLGGIATSMAMERFPHKIAVAVFVAAYMPGPDLPFLKTIQQGAPSIDYFLDCQYTYDNGPENLPTSLLFGLEYAARRLYRCSQPEDVVLASLLMRPSPLFNDPESLKGSELTKANYGSVRRVYIVCPVESAMNEQKQKWMIEKNPPDEVKVVHGADHMAMSSKPSELCSLLIEVAQKYD